MKAKNREKMGQRNERFVGHNNRFILSYYVHLYTFLCLINSHLWSVFFVRVTPCEKHIPELCKHNATADGLSCNLLLQKKKKVIVSVIDLPSCQTTLPFIHPRGKKRYR